MLRTRRSMAKQHVRFWRVSGPMADIAKSTRLTQSGPFHVQLRCGTGKQQIPGLRMVPAAATTWLAGEEGLSRPAAFTRTMPVPGLYSRSTGDPRIEREFLTEAGCSLGRKLRSTWELQVSKPGMSAPGHREMLDDAYNKIHQVAQCADQHDADEDVGDL